MPKILFGIVLALGLPLKAQYIPQGVNYGMGVMSGIGGERMISISPRIEYAPTCYTSYMATYGYQFPLSRKELSNDELSITGFHEFSFSVNTILFNFEPTYVTVGAGYMFNTSSAFDEKDNTAILFFKTGDINHGLELKLRLLIQVNLPIHLFVETNIRSLGRLYDTAGIGILYDFDLD